MNKLFKNQKLLGGIFVLAFALTGGIALLLSSHAETPPFVGAPHHAACVALTPSKTKVAPGENFSADLIFYNDGSSTWSPNFGFYLEEFRTGGRIYNPSGTALSGDVPPGGYMGFHINLAAPGAPGTYSFDWGIAVILTGFVHEPCYGPAITVTNPPVVNLNVNGQAGNITLTKGQGLSLSWSVANNPTSCSASGTWSGGKAGSGSENRTGDTATTGVKTYTLTCSNGVGPNVSTTRNVTVNNPPPTGGGSTGGGTTNTGGNTTGSGGGSSTGGSTPKPKPTPKAALPTNPTVAPATPENFSSSNENSAAVDLTWTNPTSGGAIASYELERSTDKNNWTKIGKENSTDQSFSDDSASFGATYYYRLRLIGPTGLKSDYATTEITTKAFESNVSDGTTLTSEDGLVTVQIPKEAIDQDANCALQTNNDVLPPSKNKYVTVAGPYEILCKAKDGTIIKNFKSDVTVTAKYKKGSFSALSFFTYGEDWQEVATKMGKTSVNLTLTDKTSFVLLGKKSSKTTVIKIIIWLIILVGIAVGILFLLRFLLVRRLRNKADSIRQDYFDKENGINRY